ncbi:PREDICTED: CLAVATA3/ESR (CLE)-related protein 10-like [Tarenaya hassleriana]|uniref:CLAVATA3/ESR (CLE)-related protein 10-like n=1 Tax=Tarenaya hassleriana TaxID=28532 RepID=UPI00053C2960|nr:PREDICTED: CLAVATA3/ESR (CLE)-related protein 10-like [Tarenaya hassleriana]
MPSHMDRRIFIALVFVFFLLLLSAAAGNPSSRNFKSRRSHHMGQRVHPYYAPPHRSCNTFSRPYARSMCIELERLQRSRHPPLSPPPPPPPEIDPRFGVQKRLVPSGPNPLHN